MAQFTANDIDITTTFDAEDNTVVVTDNVDYSTFDDMPLSALKGLGQCNDPFSNIVFQKLTTVAPLIDLAASATDSAAYALPETTAGAIVNGNYTVLYTVNATFNVMAIVVASINVATQEAVLPGDLTYLHVGDTLTFSGSSNANNNGVKTVAAVIGFSMGATTVQFAPGSFDTNESGLDGTDAEVNIVRTYSKTYTYTYTGCTEVTPIITIEPSCSNENIIIYDSTVTSGQTVVSRVLKLFYPEGLVDPVPNSPITTSNASYTVNELANGTYTGTLNLTMSYTQTDGLVVTYEVYTSKESGVSCILTLCGLTDCIENLYDKYAPCDDTVNNAYQTKVIKASFLMNQFNLLKGCGDIDGASAVAQELKDLLGDDCTCPAPSDVPSWVNSSVSTGTTYQIYPIFLQVTDVNPASGVSIPATFFTNAGGYIKFNLIGTDASGCTVAIDNVTTGQNLYSNVVAAGEIVSYELTLYNNGVDDFCLVGTRTIRSGGTTTLTQVGVTGLTYADVLNAQANTILVGSNSLTTQWVLIEIVGYKLI